MPTDSDAARRPAGLTASLAHVKAGCPLPYTMRARAQRLHFVGYERRIAAGSAVTVRTSTCCSVPDVHAHADSRHKSTAVSLRLRTRATRAGAY